MRMYMTVPPRSRCGRRATLGAPPRPAHRTDAPSRGWSDRRMRAGPRRSWRPRHGHHHAHPDPHGGPLAVEETLLRFRERAADADADATGVFAVDDLVH